jgi:hypothetical protein
VNLQSRSRLNFIAIFAIAAIFSSFTLWLVEESWIKYPLFVIEICVIIIIYLVLDNYAFNIKSNFPIKILSRYVISKLNIYADLVLVFSSFILVFLNIYPNIGGSSGSSGSGGLLSLPHLILAFLCVSFLSGFSILNIFKINRHLSKLEYVVISYIASFILSGFTMLALLSINEYTRSIVIPILFMSIGIISLLQRIKSNARRIYKLSSSSSSSSSAATSGIDNDYSDGKNGDDNGIDSDYSGSGSRKSSGGGGGGGGGFVRPSSLCNNVDVLAISISIIFYIVFFCLVYPNFTLVPDADIARHYNWAVVLSRTPDLYTGFNYLLFHSFEATFYVVSGLGQTISSFQTIQIVLNIFIPLAVYILAKRYLENVDKRIPAIATIFYSVLSNFAYLDFVRLKLLDNDGNILSMLGKTAEHTLNGTINFMQPFPWFVPESVSFVIFILSFALLNIKSISRLKFIAILTILIVSMYLAHVVESIIFVMFLSFYCLIFRNKDKIVKINDVLISSILAWIFVILSLFCIYNTMIQLRQSQIEINQLLSLIFPLVLLVFSISVSKLLNRYSNFKINNSFKESITKNKNILRLTSIILSSLYLFCLLTWFLGNFRTSSFEQLGISPWFVYPLMLGVVGLLAILGIRHLGDILPKSGYIIIILFAIFFMFMMGRIVSLINLDVMMTGYWEKRFVGYIFLFICILAPISLIKFKDQIKTKIDTMIQKKIICNILITIIISLVVISGFSSMAIQTYYWHLNVANGKIALDDNELQSLDYIRNVLKTDPKAFVIALSQHSNDALNFATTPYRIFYPQPLIFSKYPEMPLSELTSSNLDHAYIYVDHIKDKNFLNQALQSWLTKYLLDLLPVIYSNRETTVYNVTHISAPLPVSNTAFVLPQLKLDNSYLYPYDILSQADINYTDIYENDHKFSNFSNLIIGQDLNQSALHFAESFVSPNIHKEWEPISGTWEFRNNGLHGLKIKDIKDNVIGPDNVIINPIVSNFENTHIRTSFKINQIDASASNYISIIYSWINPNNYRTAGINIWNHDIYLFFSKVVNGKMFYLQEWPGFPTKLKYEPNKNYNLQLDLNNKRIQGIKLDNQTGIYQKSDTELGNIGISYGRVKDVSFRNFTLDMNNDENGQKMTQKYIEYVKSGGNLVIFNSNGYGSLFDYLSNKNSISKYNSTHIYNIFPLKTISVFKTSIGAGNITYINIYPLISSIENNSIKNFSFNDFGKLSFLFDNFTKNKKSYSNASTISKNKLALFKGASAKGLIKINSSSIIFTDESKPLKVRVTTSNNKHLILNNITNINLSKYNNLQIEGVNNSFFINDGNGLYSNVIFDKNFQKNYLLKIVLSHSKIIKPTLTGISNNKLINVDNVSNLFIESNLPLHILIRQPHIEMYGKIALSNLVPNLDYMKTGYLPIQNQSFYGNLSMFLPLSDYYSIATDFHANNKINLSPITTYDYLSGSFPNITTISNLFSHPFFEYIFLSIPFIILFIFIFADNLKKKQH